MTSTHFNAGRAGMATGIRPFDVGRDLPQVTDLVREAFAQELRETGSRPLHNAGLYSRLRSILRSEPANLFTFMRMFDGFVYIDQGRVVGNVSMQKLDPLGHRWQLANVAVAASHQRQGIGSRLVQAAMDNLRTLGAKHAVLQVRTDNPAARNLYAKQGFRRLGGMADLEGRCPLHTDLRPPEAAPVSALPGEEWQQILDLARVQVGGHMQWWHPIRPGDFVHDWPRRAGEWLGESLGVSSVTRFGIRLGAERLTTAIVLRSAHWKRMHKVSWWTRPQQYGQYEAAMLDTLAGLMAGQGHCRVHVQVDADHREAVAGLQAMGLHLKPSLDTMRCELAPEKHVRAPHRGFGLKQ